MRTWLLPVRITRTKKCREGFYVLFNGSRLRFATRAAALGAVDAILSMQKIQVVTVREFAARKKHRQKISVPPGKTLVGVPGEMEPWRTS